MNNSLGVTQFYSASANSSGVIVGDAKTTELCDIPVTLRIGRRCLAATAATRLPTRPIRVIFIRNTSISASFEAPIGSTSSYIYCNPAPTTANGGPCVAPATGILDAFNGANFIAPFIVDPNDPNTMLAGGLSLWRSNDIKAPGLPTWSAVKPPSSNRHPRQIWEIQIQ